MTANFCMLARGLRPALLLATAVATLALCGHRDVMAGASARPPLVQDQRTDAGSSSRASDEVSRESEGQTTRASGPMAMSPALGGPEQAAIIFDVDADGIADILEIRPLYDARIPAMGRVTVRSGKTGEALLTLVGSAPNDHFGLSAALIVDADGDGVPDIAISAPGAASPAAAEQPESRGLVRIYSGRDGAVLHTLVGGAGDRFGLVVLAVEDDSNEFGGGDVMVASLFTGAGGDTYLRRSWFDARSGERVATESNEEAGEPHAPVHVVGDINNDGIVDYEDMTQLLHAMGRICGHHCSDPADLDRDGVVSSADLARLTCPHLLYHGL